MEQLTFDLPVRTALGRGDFFVSTANANAVARLDASDDWNEGKLVLVGPEGAGKTHLAHVWAEAQSATVVKAARLDEQAALSLDGPIVVEDADTLRTASEAPLFHLHNRSREARTPLLLTARSAPARWAISLPDLQSRMAATDVVDIAPPDDALLAAVLVKLFADRQLKVPSSLVSWLVPRMERSFAAAGRLVADLDASALAEGRSVSRDMARRILENDPQS